MRRCLRALLIMLVCVCSCVATKGMVCAASGADTTAPAVTSATIKTASVNKGKNIQLDLAVVENDTGIAKIQVGNIQVLLRWMLQLQVVMQQVVIILDISRVLIMQVTRMYILIIITKMDILFLVANIIYNVMDKKMLLMHV